MIVFLVVGIISLKSNLILDLRISQIIPLILIILLLFTAFNFTNTVEIDDLSLSFDSTAKFLLNYDPDY